MMTIAPPLDTGDGAIFPYTDRNHAAGNGKNGEGDRLGTAGRKLGRVEQVFDMPAA